EKRVLVSSAIKGFHDWEALKREIHKRLAVNGEFAVLFLNISNFREYNGCYGFTAGDEVINLLARIIMEAVDELDTPDVFLSQIIADEFAVMLPIEVAMMTGEKIIEGFDREVLDKYLEEDRERGGLMIRDEKGQLLQVPLMSLAVAL